MSKKSEKENKREVQIDDLDEVVIDQPDNNDQPSRKEFPADTPAEPGKTVFTTKDIPTGPTDPVELTPEEQAQRARDAKKNQ